MPQVCFIIGERYLVTFQERYFGFFDPVRDRIRGGDRSQSAPRVPTTSPMR